MKTICSITVDVYTLSELEYLYEFLSDRLQCDPAPNEPAIQKTEEIKEKPKRASAKKQKPIEEATVEEDSIENLLGPTIQAALEENASPYASMTTYSELLKHAAETTFSNTADGFARLMEVVAEVRGRSIPHAKGTKVAELGEADQAAFTKALREHLIANY